MALTDTNGRNAKADLRRTNCRMVGASSARRAKRSAILAPGLPLDGKAAHAGAWRLSDGFSRECRDARDEAKRNLAAGSDPSAVKRVSRPAAKLSADNTFETVARDWHDVCLALPCAHPSQAMTPQDRPKGNSSRAYDGPQCSADECFLILKSIYGIIAAGYSPALHLLLLNHTSHSGSHGCDGFTRMLPTSEAHR
jgi:hypothetical protein